MLCPGPPPHTVGTRAQGAGAPLPAWLAVAAGVADPALRAERDVAGGDSSQELGGWGGHRGSRRRGRAPQAAPCSGLHPPSWPFSTSHFTEQGLLGITWMNMV